ncbi:unnamed protein product [Cylindrotheca closterium]|uniref:Uncharacterized protein n=1 Tax=Cylindrotheca closterium TaxID=2856 RepID=A0AAD2CMP1_9STRA|nr:unnamed protein product [Cylindrotheca closterium]
MPNNTQADVESGMVTPQKPKKAGMDGSISCEDVSPAKTAPLSPQTITIDVNERSRSRGVLGMSRVKSMMIVGTGLFLAGGLAYFVLEWFEIPGLEAQIDRLEGEVDRLAAENNRYELLNDELNTTVGELKGINIALNDTANRLQETSQELGFKVADLKQQNQIFEEQNGKLSKTVDDLVLVSNFLNETSEGLDDSLEQITAFLADQIASNQAILLGTLENTYRQRKDGWNCDYNSVFGGRTYTQDYNVEIPATDFRSIMDYVSNRVLDELCFDRNDFTVFLGLPEYTPLTSNRLNAAMTIYTERALDWYFPEANENGLTHNDWSTVAFDCENLEATQKYSFSS